MNQKKVQVVILFNPLNSPASDKKVLLLKTNKKRGEFWQNVTGSVEAGESSKEAAMREIHEETGINFDHNDQLIKLDVEYFFLNKQGQKVHEKVFVLFVHDLKIKISSEEHDEFTWVSFHKIKKESYKYLSNYHAFLKSLPLLK